MVETDGKRRVWRKERTLGHGVFGTVGLYAIWANGGDGHGFAGTKDSQVLRLDQVPTSLPDVLVAKVHHSHRRVLHRHQHYEPEVRSLTALLGAPNHVRQCVPKIYHAQWHAAERVGIVLMNHVRGEPLLEMMERHPHGLPAAIALSMIRQLYSVIEWTHGKAGLLHGDIKLDNLLYDEPGQRLTICDWGFAADLVPWCTQHVLAMEPRRYVPGSPLYAAPEMLHPIRAQRCDSSDWWALGVVCYIMLTGRMPFYADTPGQLLANIHHLIAQPTFRHHHHLQATLPHSFYVLLFDRWLNLDPLARSDFAVIPYVDSHSEMMWTTTTTAATATATATTTTTTENGYISQACAWLFSNAYSSSSSSCTLL